MLIDYFDVVVHIFQPETRGFYKLESLWADADITEVSETKVETKPKRASTKKATTTVRKSNKTKV